MSVIRSWRLGVLLWLLLSVLLILIGYWEKQNSYTDQISRVLSEQLPERIHEVFSDVYMDDQSEPLFIQQINRDLATLWQHQHQCTIRMTSMNQPVASESLWPFSDLLNIPWQLGDKTYQSSFLVTCQYPWLRLLGMAAGLSLLMVLLLSAVPQPVSATRSRWMKTLMMHGESLRHSHQLTAAVDHLTDAQHRLLTRLLNEESLTDARLNDNKLTAQQALATVERMGHFTEDDVQWFFLGVQHYQDLDKALAVATSGDQLVFGDEHGLVTVHGIDIKLPKTPFFYYRWYAAWRKQDVDEGWHTNPSSVRADQEGAAELIELMSASDGHQKAIKELQQNGLRAKTLDQNRNKIKDELQAVLGESLAKRYLFDSARDAKSGRSRYRLALGGEFIVLDSDE